MKRYLIAILIILTAGMTLEAKPEVRFKEKGIKTKYHKKGDFLQYKANWSYGNPLDIQIHTDGKDLKDWLQVQVGFMNSVPILMDELLFFTDEGIINMKIGNSSRTLLQKQEGTYLTERWGKRFRGAPAREWAEIFVKVGNSKDASMRMRGEGTFSRSYAFTKKDKASLLKLGTAWLKYFDK